MWEMCIHLFLWRQQKMIEKKKMSETMEITHVGKTTFDCFSF